MQRNFPHFTICGAMYALSCPFCVLCSISCLTSDTSGQFRSLESQACPPPDHQQFPYKEERREAHKKSPYPRIYKGPWKPGYGEGDQGGCAGKNELVALCSWGSPGLQGCKPLWISGISQFVPPPPSLQERFSRLCIRGLKGFSLRNREMGSQLQVLWLCGHISMWPCELL